ncbi:protein-disulfide reductase DsbD domain-containing protein [Paracoccus sp. (in: a-proteobacteria)]|uniref:protein-disulfide reductase DsbD domain-containing protein n=1 Tax=Paracoccus sp. TaxID=267 RepID=UPI0032201D52
MRIIALLLITAAPALAQDLPPGLASAELLPGWVTPEGRRISALRLRLEPGWKTYWRSPGDTGVPPRFDWQGSRNLGAARLLWPRPEVIDSGGERTLGYHDELILPIEVTPQDPARPVDLRAVVDFGLCLDICVPAQLALAAGPAGAAPDPAIRAAIASQPERSPAQPACEISEIGDGMQVHATLPDSAAGAGADVAMELMGAEVWVSAPEIGREDGRLSARADFIAASGKPFALDPAALRITLIGEGGAVEFQGCAASG